MRRFRDAITSKDLNYIKRVKEELSEGYCSGVEKKEECEVGLF